MRAEGRFLIGLSAALIGLTACPAPDPKACPYAGSADAGIAGVLAGRSPSGVFGPLADGGSIVISGAPQGGEVLYAGAYLTNFNPCGVTLAAELLSADGGAVISNRDTRQSDFSVSESGGLYGPSDISSSMPNIPVCDMLGAGILAGPSILRVTIIDVNGKQGVLEGQVQPACAPGDGFCASACGPR
jgi:hypothetical protein